ncbi:hypothetical protein [Nocardioides sediminis]|uniref:hypothetical protein n=1 Tax=Nocardioides sediminis TaxID=433648 RepID=UPI000D2F6693|nr:hypothetical protein [Nocardioides sediminis]
MPDVTELLDYTAQVRRPSLDELERVAVRRRRRVATAATSAVVAAGLAIVLATAPLGTRGASPAPVAPEPSLTRSLPPDPRIPTPPPPDRTTGPFPTLTPEEIRSHPDAEAPRNSIPVTAAPGVAARVWSVCLADCSRDTLHQEGELQEALEVSSDNFRTGALHPIGATGANISHVIGDWFVTDGFAGATLVGSGGESRTLERGEPVVVTEIAGPLVYGVQGVAYVDLEARVLHPIESPDGSLWDWWGASDSWFWGSVSLADETGRWTRHGLTWRNPDGSFGVRMLPIGGGRSGFQMPRTGVPGTMAAIDFGWPRMMHISTDYGATWEVRETPLDTLSGSRLPPDWRSWPRA